MLTRQQAIELWGSDDLIALGREADAVRKRLHPEGIVSYTLKPEEAVVEHLFARTDSIEDRLNVLNMLRTRQNEADDVLLFRPLVEQTTTGVEYMKIVALARLCLQNVPHIQASSKPFGLKVAQLSLRFGANDLGVAAADANEQELRRLIREAGFVPKQRDALFRTYSIA